MLRKLWIELRSSLWFVPGLLVLGGVLLAVMLIQIDLKFGHLYEYSRWRPFFDASAEGARGVLSAIAGSMITVAGVAFSVTIVTLSLASTQYTPRILRNFMRDRANQLVLGVFVGIFTYCLVVLRTIRASEDDHPGFVPLLAVLAAVVFALVAVAFLIFFIHHTAASIQASSLLKAITRETVASVSVLYPERMGAEESPAAAEELPPCRHPIDAEQFGYLQTLDSQALLNFASEHEIVIKLEKSIGDFIMTGSSLAFSDRELNAAATAAVRSFFVIGDFRTVEQDASFGIRQIVDIAVKALSPGVNDTSTAVSCIDHLGEILAHLGARRIESSCRRDGATLRVIAPAPAFAEYLARAFDEIRLAAPHNVSILVTSLQVIRSIAMSIRFPSRRKDLLMHAHLMRECADAGVAHPYDRARINAVLEEVRASLQLDATALPPVPERACPV